MKFGNWLNKWQLTGIKLNAKFVEAEITFTDVDRQAAWELYVELLTRVATQQLSNEDGDNLTALNSFYSLFPTTREILKKSGPRAINFSKVAIPILNQVVRPFTAKWHRIFVENDNVLTKELENSFRKDIIEVQIKIQKFLSILSEISEVEDLSNLETEE